MPSDLNLQHLQQDQPSDEEEQIAALSVFGAEKQGLDAERQRELLTGLVQDREQRKTYSLRLFVLICVWISVVFGIVIAHGCESVAFRLDQAELVTLIGSTTVNVIGLFAIVARYLFPNSEVRSSTRTGPER